MPAGGNTSLWQRLRMSARDTLQSTSFYCITRIAMQPPREGGRGMTWPSSFAASLQPCCGCRTEACDGAAHAAGHAGAGGARQAGPDHIALSLDQQPRGRSWQLFALWRSAAAPASGPKLRCSGSASEGTTADCLAVSLNWSRPLVTRTCPCEARACRGQTLQAWRQAPLAPAALLVYPACAATSAQ